MQEILDSSQLISDIPPNSLICGDCIEVMQHLADASVDMILCDLPYGTTQALWDSVIPFNQLWATYERVCKENAAMVFTAAQPFASTLIASKPEWFKYELIWVKNKATGHLNAKKQPMRNHENILVFYRSQPNYFPQMSQGHGPLHYAFNKGQTQLWGKYNGVESRTGATDRYPKSVLHFDVVNNTDRIHPSQKPVSLFSYLIKTFTKPGDVVLDNAAGSLTTMRAAIETERNYICIEKYKEHIQAALDAFPQDIFSQES